MTFWTAITVISLTAIVFGFIFSIVKISQAHFERIERIRHGLPTDEPYNPLSTDGGFIDMTGNSN